MTVLERISLACVAGREGVKARRRMLTSIGALAGGNLMSAVLGAVGGVLVARFVDPETNGQFRLFTIPLMYLTFLHLGTFDGLYRQLPFYVGQGRPDQVRRLASAAGAWNLGIAMVVGCVFFLIGAWGFYQGNWQEAGGWFSQALASAGIFYGGYLCATYRTLDNFVILARIQLVQAIFTFFLVLSVALWGFYGLCLRTALPALLGICLFHYARPLKIPLSFNIAAFKDIVKIGMPLCVWGTLYSSLWLAMEYSLMLHFGGIKAVGLLSVALVMRESLSILPQAVHQVIMPRVVESYARNGNLGKDFKKTFLAAGVLSLGMLGIVLLISIKLEYFVLLFIPKYIDGLLLMKICLGWAVIQAACLPLNGHVATGRSWLYGKGILAGLITFPLAVYLLEPLVGGMLAVALGSLFGRTVRTFVAYFDLYTLLGQERR